MRLVGNFRFSFDKIRLVGKVRFSFERCSKSANDSKSAKFNSI